MFITRKISSKLAFYILVSSGIIFALIVTYSYIVSSGIIKDQIRKNAKNMTHSIVNRIDTVLFPVEKIPISLSLFLENTNYNKQELLNIIKAFVKQNPNVYGCVVAFAPYKFDKHKLYFAPYFYRHKGNIKLKYIGSDSYRYFYWDWYQLPKELNHSTWTEPYYEKGGNAIMATYSVPFYKTVGGKKEFFGVVSVDVSLDWLKRMISSIKVGKTGYAFLISKNGRFITYPDKRFIMNETIFTIAKEFNLPYLRKIGIKMIKGQEGFIPVKSILTKKECWLSFAPISANGWSLGVMFPKKELMADISRLDTRITLIGVIGIILLAGVVVFISTSITRPLVALTRATKAVAKGKLDIEIPYTSLRDEIGKLAKSFEFMKKSLNAYIRNLKETTAAKERIESELNIAATIQASMLPRTFPPFPDRKEFDIYAVMKPAKEVGGDFYDFFFINEDKLCFFIGDVSGKGVPAALFMTVIKYLMKTEALRDVSPSEILERVNDALYPDNETCMFATVFLGILDVKTGVVEFANAGHLPPVLFSTKKEAEFLKVEKGFIVGVMDIASYKDQKITLKENELLLLYTDGVTEAMNKEDEMFSESELQKRVAFHLKNNLSAEYLVKSIKEDVEKFANGAPQSDDITMVALMFKQP